MTKRDQDIGNERHHVVTSDELEETFDDGDEVENAPRYLRRLRHGIVLSIIVILVLVALGYATGILLGRFPSPFPKAAPPVVCPTQTVAPSGVKGFPVRVYNGTSRSGLGSELGAELKKRGFNVTKVADSATGSKAPAIIVAGPSGLSHALLLQRSLPGAQFYDDHRTTNGVDVVIANGYKALAPVKGMNLSPGVIACTAPTAPPPELR